MSMNKKETYVYECDNCGTKKETKEGFLPTGWSTSQTGYFHSCRFCSDVVSLTDDKFIEEVYFILELARKDYSINALNSCKAELKRRIKGKSNA